jgi:Big-like domain-containing protein
MRIRAVALAFLVAGCNSPFGSVCTNELRVVLDPGSRTLSVGESFTPTVALSSCGGKEKLSDTFTWASRDADIADVVAQSGLVTAKAAGSTRVDVTGAEYGPVGSVELTVIPRP